MELLPTPSSPQRHIRTRRPCQLPPLAGAGARDQPLHLPVAIPPRQHPYSISGGGSRCLSGVWAAERGGWREGECRPVCSGGRVQRLGRLHGQGNFVARGRGVVGRCVCCHWGLAHVGDDRTSPPPPAQRRPATAAAGRGATWLTGRARSLPAQPSSRVRSLQRGPKPRRSHLHQHPPPQSWACWMSHSNAMMHPAPHTRHGSREASVSAFHFPRSRRFYGPRAHARTRTRTRPACAAPVSIPTAAASILTPAALPLPLRPRRPRPLHHVHTLSLPLARAPPALRAPVCSPAVEPGLMSSPAS